MHARRGTLCVLIGTGLLPVYGCLVIDIGGSLGTKLWVEETRTLELSLEDIDTFVAQTHNGSIRVRGVAGPGSAKATVTLKAGGKSTEDAEACLEALDLVSNSQNRTRDLRLTWKHPRKRRWAARADMTIQLPPDIAVRAATHNGAVTIEGMSEACEVLTHNGPIEVADNAAVSAITHNGHIIARIQGSTVHLETSNGRIEAQLRGPSAVDGSIITHNGHIRLAVDPQVSTDLECRTSNGRIRTQGAPLQDFAQSRYSLRARLGLGGAHLAVATHNGNIDVLAK